MKPELDQAKLLEKQQLLIGYSTGFSVSGAIYLGQTLGMFRAMAGIGPMTAVELAGRLGLHPRMVEEWLRAATAARILEYHGEGRFASTPELDWLLSDETNITSMQLMFSALPARTRQWVATTEAFKSGIGASFDERGEDFVTFMEMAFKSWYEHALVQQALPALDGVVPALERGMRVGDVGCGAAIALREMARAFPQSEFHGYEVSDLALTRARQNTSGLANVHLHRVPDEVLPTDSTFGLITTFDCLHDMTDPYSVAAAIRSALAPDGRWFIADIKSEATFEDNLTKNPRSAMGYSNSVFGCLQAGLSEPGGAGLGTLGLPEPEMRRLAAGAGFTRFRAVDLPSVGNAYYEARP